MESCINPQQLSPTKCPTEFISPLVKIVSTLFSSKPKDTIMQTSQMYYCINHFIYVDPKNEKGNRHESRLDYSPGMYLALHWMKSNSRIK